MDRERFGQKGHAYRHDDLTVDETSIHPDYEVKFGDPETSVTGRMVIFKLLPKTGSGPRFEGRWDDRQEELDVDVFDATNEEIKQFKAGAKGYCGHHNGKAKFASSGRTYAVRIEWPGKGTIFEGEANFKIRRKLPVGTSYFRIR
jgi:hypothetical protein